MMMFEKTFFRVSYNVGITNALFIKRVARRKAVTGDCPKPEAEQKQSFASLSFGTSFPKEADENRTPSL